MANTLKKTNACRVLDSLSVPYALRTYEVDESDLSAESVAKKLSMPAAQVFKTLCVRAEDRAVLLAVVPGDCELDLKRLALAAGKKAVSPVALKDLTNLTGYIRGGVTALACKKPYPVFLDESAQLYEEISVSAGVRGMQIVIAPPLYARAVGATFAGISAAKSAP
jgi:Cys-tRNA(Pro)/Cys-tRNA(Cys) deacylase